MARLFAQKLTDSLGQQVIVDNPDVQARFSAQGIESVGSTPSQLAAHIRSELPKWTKVVKAAGVRAD